MTDPCQLLEIPPLSFMTTEQDGDSLIATLDRADKRNALSGAVVGGRLELASSFYIRVSDASVY